MNIFTNCTLILHILLYNTQLYLTQGYICIRRDIDSPLALIRKNRKFELAKPVKIAGKELYACYVADEPVVLVCPPDETNEEISSKRIREVEITNGKILYEIQTPYNENIRCTFELEPSVHKIENHRFCYNNGSIRKGDLYEVGYWVRNDRANDLQRIPLYHICHDGDNTIYTIHTIEPSGFLIPSREYEPDTPKKSILDQDYEKATHFYQENLDMKKYQLVSIFDMPLSPGRKTTLYFFNIVPVSRLALAHLEMVDNYIRKSILKMSSVQVYAGQYTTVLPTPMSDSNHTQTNTFIWRLLRYDNTAIIIITLIYPANECVEICENISEQTKWLALRHPTIGQCTYTCEVDKIISKLFGFSEWGSLPRMYRINSNASKATNNGYTTLPLDKSGADDSEGLIDFNNNWYEEIKRANASIERIYS